MRALLTLLHRWFGLAAALFLFIAGATGALIAWDHELDAAINPQLYHARSGAAPLAMQDPGLALARRVEAQDARLRVRYVQLEVEPGHTAVMMVDPATDAHGQPYPLDFNQIAVDPATGAIQGKRMWGAVSLAPENLLPFLYKLHYSLHIPSAGGIELGVWLMGVIGIVWVLDCFIALVLSFPSRRSWRKSFAFRWSAGGHKLNFDLHRSGGVWCWLLLLMLAVTSVSMNLNAQVMRPLVGAFSTLSADPFAARPAQATLVEPRISRERVLALARDQALARGWNTPAGAVFYASAVGLYGVGFFEPGNEHGDTGLGNAWLYFDAVTGQPAGARIP
ncbi:MAG: PepSY-associated TM helix domain-containing protein, partial [Gammaproteobacteria bacterium]